ncbi:MAG: efflux RND transporter periplasmic adaptor subunit [Bryobacteraceae bacterium]|nr:efflux RND transporter periplasmic adaptor subunit [Bryobacteraceae bacterium]MDW8380399.1 efflux RND transporter periplasmic adaptor subunit [Bryobacterales bacterium]
MSKDLKPKQRLGQVKSTRRKAITWILLLAGGGGAGYAAYHRYQQSIAKVEVPVVKVRKAEFVISVKTRGEIRSVRSEILTAPQVPEVRIVKLAESGKLVKKGDIIVEFDAASQEQQLLERTTSVRTVESEIVQTKASHRITDEMDSMNLMTAEYNVQRAKLEASKAEVVSEIEGAKNRIDVGISEGELNQVKTTIKAHEVAQNADLERLQQKKDKTVRDMERARSYLSKMVLRAPNDGLVNILPNFRSQGAFGTSPPAFKEGDRAWTGAAIAEIPDLSQMRIELKLDEVDRGKLRLGQKLRVNVDAIPDKEFFAELDWISPIASVVYRGMGLTEKSFPARATLKNLDPRLRPGMSASAEVVIESQPDALLIPIRASFMHQGKPAVYVQRGQTFEIRHIQVGKRNDTDIVVVGGLKEGELVALENPAEAAKRARKL